jgi:hypothetical protein
MGSDEETRVNKQPIKYYQLLRKKLATLGKGRLRRNKHW